MADRPSEIQRRSVDILALPAPNAQNLIGARAGFRIFVVSLVLTAEGNEEPSFQDGVTTLFEPRMMARVPLVMPPNEGGWFVGASGQAIWLSTNTGNVRCQGVITWRYVPDHVEV